MAIKTLNPLCERIIGETPLVIIISYHNDQTLMRKVKLAGGNAFLLKDSGIDELISTIRTIKAGKFLPNKRVASVEDNATSTDQFKLVFSLTERERDVVTELIKGVPASEVAKKLFISEYTVKNHRKNIYRKLNVSTVQELILFCNHLGLLG